MAARKITCKAIFQPSMREKFKILHFSDHYDGLPYPILSERAEASQRKPMRFIKRIFISIIIILVFQHISLAQPSWEQSAPGAKQVQTDDNSSSNKAIDNSNNQEPEIEIVSIRYEKSVTVPIDLSQGLNLDDIGLTTEKEITAPSGYIFFEVTFKLNNIEIGNLEIDDIEITDPDGNKDIPIIFIDATWNVSIQSFITRSSYHPTPKETIPCAFVIEEKFRDKELMLSIAKYNLKKVIPRVFEFKDQNKRT